MLTKTKDRRLIRSQSVRTSQVVVDSLTHRKQLKHLRPNSFEIINPPAAPVPPAAERLAVAWAAARIDQLGHPIHRPTATAIAAAAVAALPSPYRR